MCELENLFLLHVEVVDDDADKEVESEEGTKDDEKDKVEVHVDSYLGHRLQTRLHASNIHTNHSFLVGCTVCYEKIVDTRFRPRCTIYDEY